MDTARVGAAEDVLRFGPFTLRPVQRVLDERGARIPLGSRAFDILLLLLERAGTFVSKSDIVARVWPTTVVIESNLRVHMTALRKALGDGRDGQRYIVTVPNRGYSFVQPVSHEQAQAQATPPARTMPGLPLPLHRIIGRDAAAAALARQIRGNHLVTVVGPGGIGKTTLAVTVAASREPAPWNAAHFVDLAPVAQGRMAADAIAAALGLRVVGDPRTSILAFLKDSSALLLLDNCEHVLSDVTGLAEAILHAAPGVRLLATSREPLRADGERIHQLQPLELPASGEHLTAAEALGFGAIEFFVDCATAALDSYVFQDADVDAVAQVCRRLDGIPLAIELAAAFVSSLGVRGVGAALESRLLQSQPSRRTATPRHQTLQSMVDWSLALLSPFQRQVLARLSMFSSSFTLESAGALAQDDSSTTIDVFEAVMELAAKSLLTVDVSGDPTYFRLLETTRVHAARRLLESGELPALRRRHAEHTQALMRMSEAAWRDADAGAWRQRYGRHVDDVRSALAWAMSAEGDLALGVSLTARSAQFLFLLSRVEECAGFLRDALDALLRLDEAQPRLEFELRIIYGFMLVHAQGVQPETQRSLDRATAIATELGDAHLLALAASANWTGAFLRSDPQAMLEFVRRFETLTADDRDPATGVLYDRMTAHPLHLLGDQRGARSHAEKALALPAGARPPFLSGSWTDLGASMGMLLTRALWLQGLPDQAEDMAQRSLARARREGESLALAYVLGFAACPLAFWTGRLDLARERVALLQRHTAEHSLLPWRAFALAFESLLDWHEGGRRGAPRLPEGFEIDRQLHQLADLLATLHPAWACERTFARGETGAAGWAQAELLRLRAERCLDAGRLDEAGALLLRSLGRSRLDGALSWELRTTTSLARLRARQGRQADGIAALRAVVERFDEGLDTADVQEATRLLQALADPCA